MSTAYAGSCHIASRPVWDLRFPRSRIGVDAVELRRAFGEGRWYEQAFGCDPDPAERGQAGDQPRVGEHRVGAGHLAPPIPRLVGSHASILLPRVWRRRTGIEPAWPGYRATPVLKTGRGTSHLNASGATLAAS